MGKFLLVFGPVLFIVGLIILIIVWNPWIVVAVLVCGLLVLFDKIFGRSNVDL